MESAEKRLPTLIEKIDGLVRLGRHEAATLFCQMRLDSNPNDCDALYLSGTVHVMTQAFELGIKPFVRLLELEPSHLNAWTNLGVCYLGLKRFHAAADCFKKVLFFDPNNVMARNNLGAICAEQKNHKSAVHHYEEALKVTPDDIEIMTNLTLSYHAIGEKEAALSLALQIVKTEHLGRAIFPLFNLFNRYCAWEETAEVLPNLVQKIGNENVSANDFEHINLALLTDANLSPDRLFEILKKAGGSIISLRKEAAFQHTENASAAVKRWRVGYLSPDFRKHVVHRFISGLLKHHDPSYFEVFCYSNTREEDELTAKYRRLAEQFIDVSSMNDREVAEKIYADGIHFLIDLSGFTEGGRLPVLSYRPAPVQIMYLGYPYTSGLETVDYFMSDSYLDGPENSVYFTESMLKLPASFVSFFPIERPEVVNEPPCIKNQWVTFGVLVNPYKLNPEVISVWSEILQALPGSKLILNHPEYDFEVTRSNILKRFLEHGIDSKYISFIWHSHPSGNFLQYYNEIDIVLDPFPATGGTTTIDALQMGKPVVTLVGDVNYERLSYSILKNVGIELDDLIAFTQTEYIEKAIALSLNPERIRVLHRKIPEALKTSILCDPPRFTRQMETLYLEAWKKKYDFVPVSACVLPVSESVSV